MSTKTDEQLAGTKQRKSSTPVAKATRAKARKSDYNAAGSDGTKAGRNSGGNARKKAATTKKHGSPKSKPEGIPEEELEHRAPSGVKTSGVETAGVEPAAESAVGGNLKEIGGDGVDKASGTGANEAGNSGTNGDPIKPLTEAGKKRLVNKLLGLADSQATQGAFKITPADLIRLMQLHKEMNPQKDRKVTVQWIEDKPE